MAVSQPSCLLLDPGPSSPPGFPPGLPRPARWWAGLSLLVWTPSLPGLLPAGLLSGPNPLPCRGSRAQSSQPTFSGLVSSVKTHSQSLPPLLGPRKNHQSMLWGKCCPFFASVRCSFPREVGVDLLFSFEEQHKVGIFVHNALHPRRPVFSWATATPGLDSGSRGNVPNG